MEAYCIRQEKLSDRKNHYPKQKANFELYPCQKTLGKALKKAENV